MNTNPCIVILTATYGDGHLQAANTLKQTLQMKGIDKVLIVDLMKEAHPLLNRISTKLYANSAQYSQLGLDYYGWSYYMTRGTKPGAKWNRYFDSLGKATLREVLERERPIAVISTFPYGTVPELCKRMGIPSFTVITDFTFHARWLHQDVDKYYVAVPDLKEELVFHGFPRGRIEVSGIPIRKPFEDYECRGGVSTSCSIDKRRSTILILAGAFIEKTLNDMIRSLQQLEYGTLVIVCGRNEKLERKLKLKYSGQCDVVIHGYMENIHETMSTASCIVTKAGGLTLSETVALKKPLFIFKPFAGQEYENAKYLARKRVALVSFTGAELELQIRRFLSDEAAVVDQISAMSALKQQRSADFIAHDIIQTVSLTSDRAKTE
jgi:processive 1,2-diacylglycerol beta-glucosyltransferase